jgi:predicted PolB exonuclease-like 3'-5' exonuclease
MRFYFDIETLPASGKDVQLIKKFYEEMRTKKNGEALKVDFNTFHRNTSFQGEFGRIFCIGYARDDEPAEALRGDEKQILIDFWEEAREEKLFIGHNIMEFDFRFIYKRSIINGVRPSRDLNFARYRSDPIFDTMKEWEKWGAQGTSLHKLSIALGIASPKEEGIDGAKVYDYFLAGRGDEIVEYCKRDVEATRKVYKKMTFLE